MKLNNSLCITTHRACTLAVGAMLCCTVYKAAAADWTPISKTKQHEVLVDMDSYNESAGMPYISTKTRYVKPQIYQKSLIKISYSESHSTAQFNCSAHTYKINSTQFYGANKKLIGSEKGDISFKPITADSKEAELESLVCQVHKMVGGN